MLNAIVILLVTVLLTAACDDRGPTTPTPSRTSSVQTHVRGQVSDTLARPVPGARIAVADGPAAGGSTTADYRGAFELVSNATGGVRLRATQDGFETGTIATVWQPPTSVEEVRFHLKTLAPPLSITPGAYTLTVTSDLSAATGTQSASCEGFPADLLRRTYDASISIRPRTGGDDFVVALASPTLTNPPGVTCLGNPNPVIRGCFSFQRAGQFVGFEIENGWGWDWIEEWPGFRYLTIQGLAPTSEPVMSTDTSMTIPFWGTFEYCQLKSPLNHYSSCYRVPAEEVIEYRSCSSRLDTMVFTKR